jgi:hypothetical protein
MRTKLRIVSKLLATRRGQLRMAPPQKKVELSTAERPGLQTYLELQNPGKSSQNSLELPRCIPQQILFLLKLLGLLLLYLTIESALPGTVRMEALHLQMGL